MSRNKLFLIASALIILVGCKNSSGQLPPTPPTPVTVVLTWTAPANCTGCTYVISAASVAAGTPTCPVPNTTTPNYPIQTNPSPGTSALTLTETPTPGTTVCYIAQTIQNGLISQPSNTAGPLVIGSGTQPPAAPVSLSGK